MSFPVEKRHGSAAVQRACGSVFGRSVGVISGSDGSDGSESYGRLGNGSGSVSGSEFSGSVSGFVARSLSLGVCRSVSLGVSLGVIHLYFSYFVLNFEKLQKSHASILSFSMPKNAKLAI
ncbi:MAG: hypothetical protein KOO69_07360 [Victivallales bacterium]|nr:hypothetical protein [Victivallales bacterium]